MFLADPRTMTLMLEPRIDNEKYVPSLLPTPQIYLLVFYLILATNDSDGRFINYLHQAGFYKEKEFSFPHKQAALMKLKREAWQGPPC